MTLLSIVNKAQKPGSQKLLSKPHMFGKSVHLGKWEMNKDLATGGNLEEKQIPFSGKYHWDPDPKGPWGSQFSVSNDGDSEEPFTVATFSQNSDGYRTIVTSAPVMPGSFIELTHRGHSYNSRNFMGICTHNGMRRFNERSARANDGSIDGRNSCFSMQADGYIYCSNDSASGFPNFRPRSRLKISVLPVHPAEWEELKNKGGPFPETIQCRIHFSMDGGGNFWSSNHLGFPVSTSQEHTQNSYFFHWSCNDGDEIIPVAITDSGGSRDGCSASENDNFDDAYVISGDCANLHVHWDPKLCKNPCFKLDVKPMFRTDDSLNALMKLPAPLSSRKMFVNSTFSAISQMSTYGGGESKTHKNEGTSMDNKTNKTLWDVWLEDAHTCWTQEMDEILVSYVNQSCVNVDKKDFIAHSTEGRFRRKIFLWNEQK